MIEDQATGQGRPSQASADNVMETPGQGSSRKLTFQTPQTGNTDTGVKALGTWCF